MNQSIPRSVQYLPGIGLLVVIALIATFLAHVIPVGSPLILAIALSLLLANLVRIPDLFTAGIGMHSLFLEVGIVLLGSRLMISDLFEIGPLVVGLSILVIIAGVAYIEFLSRTVFDLPRKIGALLATGASICGVSATVAVAGSIDADDDQLAYVVATILLFDALTLFSYPVLGSVFGLSSKSFGLWAGLTMFSTGPVAAAGFMHSELAGQWATITKLVRNSFIGLAALTYSFWYAREQPGATRLYDLWRGLPKFLFGFLVVVLFVNVAGISAAQATVLDRVTDGVFLLAFAGLGFDIRLDNLRRTGIIPIAVVLVYLLTVAPLVLLILTLVL